MGRGFLLSTLSLCLSLLCHLQLPQGTPNTGWGMMGGTSFPCRFAMAPSATSTATHYRRVCFMKVVSNSSPHTLLRLLTLAAQKDSGHARTGKAPPSGIRRRSSGGGKTSSCQSPFACHHSHHFRQRQMRRLALLSEAAFLLPHFFALQLFMCPCFMTLLYVPLCPHTVPFPLSLLLHCPLKLLERYLFKIKHFACPANQKFVPALQSANRAAVSKATGGVGCGGRVGSGSWSGADGMSPKFIIIAYDNSRKEI